MPDEPIAHLYFFDDLSHHLRRICRQRRLPDSATTGILRKAANHLHRALATIDASKQDIVLITWNHACIQLAWELEHQDTTFDLVVSQGCNGQYALDSLLDVFRTTYSRELTTATANVRSTHLLTDPSDAFHSEFHIDVSSGPPLDKQCQTALHRILEPSGESATPYRIAVFDDCIQTGKGTQAVAELLCGYLPAGSSVDIHTIGLIACQATQQQFASRGWHPAQGVLLPGQTYPNAWDTDVYFLKDLILSNAIRYANGTSQAYLDNPDWMRRIFGKDPESAMVALDQLRSTLIKHDIYLDFLEL